MGENVGRNYYYIESFVETFKEFTENSSISGYKYLTDKHGVERLFWYLIHLSTVTFVYLLASYNWQQFMTNPAITTLETYSYPISEIPLPGISICSLNKLSKSKVQTYSNYLSNKSGIPWEEIFENVKLFGRMYDFSIAPTEEEELVQFQNLLDKFDPDIFGVFNTHNALKSLTLSCPELISDCYWKGATVKCEDIFVTELTMEGHCCVFNYYSDQSTTSVTKALKENNLKPLKSGDDENGGISLKIFTNESDYMYTTLASVGAKVLVSLPTDYADTTSGSLTESLVDVGSEIFLKLSSITTFTTAEVKKYAIDKRSCMFSDEETTLFGGYSYSDCLMDCKIKSIVALCECIPFNYINVFPHNPYEQCSLADLKCLSSYAAKWRTLYPLGNNEDNLDRERQDSLMCQNCVPACSDTTYSVKSEVSVILPISDEILNYSILHINFEKPFGILNKQDVIYYWFDIISIFGGICSLIMGISIISIVEVVYFFTFRFYCNFKKMSKKIEQLDN